MLPPHTKFSFPTIKDSHSCYSIQFAMWRGCVALDIEIKVFETNQSLWTYYNAAKSLLKDLTDRAYPGKHRRLKGAMQRLLNLFWAYFSSFVFRMEFSTYNFYFLVNSRFRRLEKSPALFLSFFYLRDLFSKLLILFHYVPGICWIAGSLAKYLGSRFNQIRQIIRFFFLHLSKISAVCTFRRCMYALMVLGRIKKRKL